MKACECLAKWMMCATVMALLGVGISPAEADSVLWEQQAHDGGGALWTSGGMASFYYADDFEVDMESEVERLTWWGTLEGSEPMPESFDFDIILAGDSSTESFSVSSTAVATDLQADLTNGTFGEGVYRDVYEFSVEFSTPLTLESGTHYISVDSPSEDWVFGWMMSEDGNQLSWYTDDPNSDWVAQEYDFAYRLEGRIIPEPVSAGLLTLGIVVFVVRRKLVT